MPRFAPVTVPLRSLLGKDIPSVWTSECEAAFKSINEEIASNRVIAHLEGKLLALVSTDASSVSYGAVLSQDRPGEVRLVPFALRTFTDAERAYAVVDREALACIWGCEHCHFYL